MKASILLLIVLLPFSVRAQSETDSLSLEYCYQQVELNYPTVKKFEIEQKISGLNQRIASSGLYPEVQLKMSASYQSDVTEVPFASSGTTPVEFSKDHYNISLQVNQILFDGWQTRNSEVLERKKSETETAVAKADLWKVRNQLEQVYFGILQLQKNLETIHLLKNDIEEQLQLVNARVENGILLPGNARTLQAELLQIEQKIILIKSNIEASYEVLSLLTGQEIDAATKLQIPIAQRHTVYQKKEINRPELDVFSKREEVLRIQQNLTDAAKYPKIAAFGTAAYGRPGLNMFDDDLQSYWIVGVRAQWSFRNWNNSGKKAEVLELQKHKLKTEEESFMLNVKSELSKTERKINQLEKQIELDEKVLELRKQVVAEKEEQLQEAAITSTEYLTEVNAKNRALLQLELRRIELKKTIIDYLTQKGISWN